MFFFFLRAAVNVVLQPYHTCQIALCTSFVVLVSWQINDDDDDDDNAYGNYNYFTGRPRSLGPLTNFCTNFYDFF